MQLKKIELTHFKSHRRQQFDFHPKLNIIHGLNGSGKTNLLDAIYTLAMSKSYFQTVDSKLRTWRESFYRIAGELIKSDESYSLVVKSVATKKKVVEKDGKAYDRLADHLGFMPLVMIAPDDLLLINGDNADRRRFVDQTLAQVDRPYLEALMTYKHLLKQRNRILRESMQTGRPLSEPLLMSYSERMASPAEKIRDARATFFRSFEPRVAAFHQDLSGHREQISLRYRTDQDERSFMRQSQDQLPKDRALGRSSVGPHRDQVEVLLDDNAIKIFGSQGQKKSLVLALKLAQYEMIVSQAEQLPILLLDDLFDRLDHERVKRLLSCILRSDFGQVFITDTSLVPLVALIGDQEYQSIEITFDKDSVLPDEEE